MITGKVKGRSINAVIFPSMSDDFLRFLPSMREDCYVCAEVIQIHVIIPIPIFIVLCRWNGLSLFFFLAVCALDGRDSF